MDVDDIETDAAAPPQERRWRPPPRGERVRVRNRRFRHMQHLVAEGTYFSDEEMKARCPWLYDQFVGMYQTDEEIATRIEAVEGGSWAGQLLQHIVSQQAGERLAREQQAAGEAWQEEEEEEKEDEETDPEARAMYGPTSEAAAIGELEGDEREAARLAVSDAERIRLRREFVEMMKERFLRGEDAEFFNYAVVDQDPDLDDLEAVGREAEEAYFASD